MGIQYSQLTKDDMIFIKKQHLFYIASSSGQEVNLSPKGYHSIHILDENRLLYLDFPGSGNRTVRDIENGGEITLVFNSFLDSEAKILRIFVKGEVVSTEDENALKYASKFGININYIRQFLIFNIYAVETSCGEAIPVMSFIRVRSGLSDWVKDMSKSGKIKEYIEDHKIPPSLENLERKEILIATKLLKAERIINNEVIEKIAEITGLSEDEIQEIIKKKDLK